MMPMPGIEQQAAVEAALLCELQHLRHAPDELVGISLADVQRPEELQAEAHVVLRQNRGGGAESTLVEGAELAFRRLAGGRNIGHHAQAADGIGESGRVIQLLQVMLEGDVVLPKFHRKAQNRRRMCSCSNNVRVAAAPSLRPASSATATPGYPSLAARRANPGHGTLPAVRTAFIAIYTA